MARDCRAVSNVNSASRLSQRSRAQQRIKVFSNIQTLELLLNGVSQGMQQASYGTLIWPDVQLRAGKNDLRLRDRQGRELDKVELHYAASETASGV